MGLSYEKRGRLHRLDVRDDDRLISYSLGTHDINFEHHTYEDVANIVNRELDEVERRLKEDARRA